MSPLPKDSMRYALLAGWVLYTALVMLFCSSCSFESKRVEVGVVNQCPRPIIIDAQVGRVSRNIEIASGDSWEGWIYAAPKSRVTIRLRQRFSDSPPSSSGRND